MNQTKNILAFNNKWNMKHISLFIILLILPNFLGLINIKINNINIHFFQIAIFLAAIIYGPLAGLSSGLIGSIYSAYITGNPYLIIGNMILGFCVGLFIRMKFNTVLAVLTAFAIQLILLVPADYYLMHLPMTFILLLITTLAISNTIWAVAAHYIAEPLRN